MPRLGRRRVGLGRRWSRQRRGGPLARGLSGGFVCPLLWGGVLADPWLLFCSFSWARWMNWKREENKDWGPENRIKECRKKGQLSPKSQMTPDISDYDCFEIGVLQTLIFHDHGHGEKNTRVPPPQVPPQKPCTATQPRDHSIMTSMTARVQNDTAHMMDVV